MPKFNLTADYTLTNALAKMGMPDLMNSGLADLSGMLSPKNKHNNPLYLETAIHKTVLKVSIPTTHFVKKASEHAIGDCQLHTNN